MNSLAKHISKLNQSPAAAKQAEGLIFNKEKDDKISLIPLVSTAKGLFVSRLEIVTL